MTVKICKTEYWENNIRFCRYTENKTYSAAKLGA